VNIIYQGSLVLDLINVDYKIYLIIFLKQMQGIHHLRPGNEETGTLLLKFCNQLSILREE